MHWYPNRYAVSFVYRATRVGPGCPRCRLTPILYPLLKINPSLKFCGIPSPLLSSDRIETTKRASLTSFSCIQYAADEIKSDSHMKGLKS